MSSNQNAAVPRIFGGVGQWASTVPTSTTNAVIRVSSTQTFYHTARKTESHPPLPPRAFWFARTPAKACDTVTARLALDEHKNGAWQKLHWARGANPSKRGRLH